MCFMPEPRHVRNRENDPPFLILTSLISGPKHGYALMQDIEGFAGVRLGPGSLYGAYLNSSYFPSVGILRFDP